MPFFCNPFAHLIKTVFLFSKSKLHGKAKLPISTVLNILNKAKKISTMLWHSHHTNSVHPSCRFRKKLNRF
uniref:Uncharacterized protein n=1 Tax=Pararge aegeria TaxID=116150 RepID=S4P7U3_9NEOP